MRRSTTPRETYQYLILTSWLRYTVGGVGALVGTSAHLAPPDSRQIRYFCAVRSVIFWCSVSGAGRHVGGENQDELWGGSDSVAGWAVRPGGRRCRRLHGAGVTGCCCSPRPRPTRSSPSTGPPGGRPCASACQAAPTDVPQHGPRPRSSALRRLRQRLGRRCPTRRATLDRWAPGPIFRTARARTAGPRRSLS
jgi:hypothetical protein